MGGSVSTSNRVDVGEEEEDGDGEDGDTQDGQEKGGEVGDGEEKAKVDGEGKGEVEVECSIINEPSTSSDKGDEGKGNYLLFTIERRSPFGEAEPVQEQQKATPKSKADPAGNADWWGSVMGRWQGPPGAGGVGMGMGGAGDDYARTSARWTDVRR